MLKMKYVVLFVVVVLVFSGLVTGSSECEAAVSKPTPEWFNCELIKPAETIVGDEVVVNCSKREKIKNRLVITPLEGVRISITGYDSYGNPLQANIGDLREGRFVFIPRIAGDYLIKVGNEAQIILNVGETPDAYGTPTAAAVAIESSADAEESSVEAAESGGEGDVGQSPPEVTQTGSEAASESEEEGLLDFVVNEMEEDEPGDGVSGFVLMLVSLLIS